jgi:hypothetical protein
MGVSEKAFEVVAECALAGFPSGTDISKVTERIERACKRRSEVARSAVQTPAVYKDRAYTLMARFLVRAADGPRALDTVGALLQDAGVHCRGMHLSGRVVAGAELRAAAAAPATAARKSRSGARPAARGKRAPRRPRATTAVRVRRTRARRTSKGRRRR